jgi:hypothetical protein
MKNDSTTDRPLADEPVQVWIYQDNYEELMKLCEEKRCPPGDVLRDAFDEWLTNSRLGTSLFGWSATERYKTDKSSTSSGNILYRILERPFESRLK